jgi:hypothetical protein
VTATVAAGAPAARSHRVRCDGKVTNWEVRTPSVDRAPATANVSGRTLLR